jgi:hypothetical protein
MMKGMCVAGGSSDKASDNHFSERSEYRPIKKVNNEGKRLDMVFGI